MFLDLGKVPPLKVDTDTTADGKELTKLILM